MTETPRPEYPRPQFERENWLCLNGEWQFEIDAGDTGASRGLVERELNSKITVPFCPESPLSGVHHVDQMNAVWYRKTVTIPADWQDQNVILHFGAVDYDAMVWVQSPASLAAAKEVAQNSEKPMSTEQIDAASYVHAGRHRGGFSPFSLPLLDVEAGDEITIVLRARDDLESPKPRGKQSQLYQNHGCMYYRTTGIWQTVWLEPVPEVHLLRPRLTPDVSGNTITLEQPLSNVRDGLKLRATISDDKGDIETLTVRADLSMAPQITFRIPEERVHLWQAGDGFLYNINIELLDGETVTDKAKSYAGLRSVALNGKAIKINGEAVFQRLVLDQGFYEDGIFTAPSDEALIKDIELSIEAGFNGARLHQKVFEERFLYHADRMGYLCWGEFADWGCRVGRGPEEQAQYFDISYAAQWLEVLERDYSKPSIVGWCALNETWEEMTDEIRSLDSATRALWLCAKTADKTRPVLDASGYSHRVLETDIYDCHDYEQEPDKFKDNQKGLAQDTPYMNKHYTGGHRPMNTPYRGQPFFVSEFGGIKWEPVEDENGEQTNRNESGNWGYGKSVRTLEEFYQRFDGLCKVLLDDPNMFGYCYTQLTDVYQEVNGIYFFDRSDKFDIERIRNSQIRPAAIEKAKK